MTAATLGASAAVPGLGLHQRRGDDGLLRASDPVAAGFPRPTASPCLSNSDTMVCEDLLVGLMPSTKYVSGQVKPSTDVWSPWYFERT